MARGSAKATVRRPGTISPETKPVKPPEQEQHVIVNEDSLPDKTQADVTANYQDDGVNEPDPNNVATTNLETKTIDARAQSRDLVRAGKANLSANYQPHADPDLEAAKRT